MSNASPPRWKTREGQEEADFDAIWLYEHAWEWTFKVEADGLVICHYLSSEIMPKGNTYIKEQERMTKQLPPRHPATGRFVTQEHAASTRGKGNKASTKPAQATPKGKASVKEGK